jgi:hypothetical protein
VDEVGLTGALALNGMREDVGVACSLVVTYIVDGKIGLGRGGEGCCGQGNNEGQGEKEESGRVVVEVNNTGMGDVLLPQVQYEGG